jgi:hypothetical protein
MNAPIIGTLLRRFGMLALMLLLPLALGACANNGRVDVSPMSVTWQQDGTAVPATNGLTGQPASTATAQPARAISDMWFSNRTGVNYASLGAAPQTAGQPIEVCANLPGAASGYEVGTTWTFQDGSQMKGRCITFTATNTTGSPATFDVTASLVYVDGGTTVINNDIFSYAVNPAPAQPTAVAPAAATATAQAAVAPTAAATPAPTAQAAAPALGSYLHQQSYDIVDMAGNVLQTVPFTLTAGIDTVEEYQDAHNSTQATVAGTNEVFPILPLSTSDANTPWEHVKVQTQWSSRGFVEWPMHYGHIYTVTGPDGRPMVFFGDGYVRGVKGFTNRATALYMDTMERSWVLRPCDKDGLLERENNFGLSTVIQGGRTYATGNGNVLCELDGQGNPTGIFRVLAGTDPYAIRAIDPAAPQPVIIEDQAMVQAELDRIARANTALIAANGITLVAGDHPSCPTTPAEAASLIGGEEGFWTYLNSDHGYAKWKLNTGSQTALIDITHPGFGSFDHWQKGDAYVGNISQTDSATFNCHP